MYFLHSSKVKKKLNQRKFNKEMILKKNYRILFYIHSRIDKYNTIIIFFI